MTRRDNNKKIMALHTEIVDTVSVLTQLVQKLGYSVSININVCSRLENVKDPEAVGPDGQTIEDRMKGLVLKTAKDIENCANGTNFILLRCLLSDRHLAL